ncbi:programmed cell death protein 6-like protein [Catenaria anguillulae PL171]|uniref:Programmed cell death protein 6-like protein n=1 Tax=Catenaria anguillulae PL171 TaxID=765915 RepID=A0A1Y2I034_9FUNG|nr:programmed cell death protein 6-like protein [Catenaria anguillulae PL171]
MYNTMNQQQQQQQQGYPNLANPGQDPKLLQALQSTFARVDNNGDGRISAVELREALRMLGLHYFNEETCRLLVNLHDFDGNGMPDGTIDIQEFVSMWTYINQWRAHFQSFDADGSGSIDTNELQQALYRFGFNLTHELVSLLIRKYDRYGQGSITFDSFVQCCVTVQGLTRSFRQFDHTGTGIIQISYHDFLRLVMTQNI